MTDYTTIWELPPDDPVMQKIRTEYFRITGHYGSEDEIKQWYISEDFVDTFYHITPKENVRA